jgi:tRNA(fMet)-specific endonuclease VapC
MAARYLLDTDICSYVRRNAYPALRERFERLAPGEAVISVITHGEMIYGAVKSTAPALGIERIEKFVQALRVLALPPEAALVYGNIRAALAGAGNSIGPNDLWIAAHALAENLILVTNNEREFRRVKGLKIENWAR